MNQHRSRRTGRLVGVLLTVVLAVGAGPVIASATPPGDDEPESAGVSWLVQPAGPHGGADKRSYLVHDLRPGESVEEQISITNTSEVDLTLRVLGSDAFTDDSGGFGLLPTDQVPREVGSWVRLDAPEVTIPARQQAVVPLVITVPTDAAPGDHAGGLVTSYTSQAADEAGRPVLLEARIAMRIYVNVAGLREPQLAIRDLSSSFDLSSNKVTGALHVTYLVHNSGNVRLGVEERSAVTGPWSVPLGSPVVGAIDEILPGGSMRREVTIEDVPAALAVTAHVTLRPIDRTDAAQPLPALTARETAVAVPWAALLLVTSVLAATALFVYRRRRRWQILRAELALALAGGVSVVEE